MLERPVAGRPHSHRGRERSSRPRGVIGRLRLLLSSVVAGVLGVAPHVLHHAGPLAGAALFAGVGGTLLFGALGLVAAVPMLLRMRRRTGGWRAPAAALTLFAVLFSVSSFVIGPAITGGDDEPESRPPSAPANTTQNGHDGHH